MRLTLQTDYALRLMLYLASVDAEQWVPVSSVAKAYGISSSHLTKTAQTLSRSGYIESKTGPKGGVRLAMAPEQIMLGRVVRELEPDLAPVPCLSRNDTQPGCAVEKACGLKSIFSRAMDEFLASLDDKSLAQCVPSPAAVTRLLKIGPGSKPQRDR